MRKNKINGFFLCRAIFIILFLLTPKTIFSQETYTYRVFFKDKGPEEFYPGSALYKKTLSIHTQKCLNRRSKVFSSDSIISIEDAPVRQDYIDSLAFFGAKIKLVLRWNNYVVLEADSLLAKHFEKFAFVKKIQKTSSRFSPNGIYPVKTKKPDLLAADKLMSICGPYSYGNSAGQITPFSVNKVHELGYNGKGVLVGFLDSGFDLRNKAFDSIDLVAQYDFINNDSITSNETGDNGKQTSHGTGVLSILAGLDNGNLVGIAPKSSIILAKTEDLNSETRIEEDYYAAAIEWMEALGADISSSSLAYRKFDSTDASYSFADLNGKKTIAADIINKAVKRGMVCVTSAGNSGPEPATILTPGDADSAITVAAIDYNSGVIKVADFSSRGPVNSNAVKPDVAALGVGVFSAKAGPDDNFRFIGGTSAAAPIIAGYAALILNAHPQLRPWEVRSLLYRSSNQYENPDLITGYGYPNIYNAIISEGLLITPLSHISLEGKILVFTRVFSKDENLEVKLKMRSGMENIFKEYKMTATGYNNYYIAEIPFTKFNLKTSEAFATVEKNGVINRIPADESQYYLLNIGEDDTPCGLELTELIKNIDYEFTADLLPNVITKGDVPELKLFTKKSGFLNLYIYGTTGELVFSERYWIFNNKENLIPVNMNSVSSGLYFIVLTSKNFSKVLPLVVNR